MERCRNGGMHAQASQQIFKRATPVFSFFRRWVAKVSSTRSSANAPSFLALHQIQTTRGFLREEDSEPAVTRTLHAARSSGPSHSDRKPLPLTQNDAGLSQQFSPSLECGRMHTKT